MNPQMHALTNPFWISSCLCQCPRTKFRPLTFGSTVAERAYVARTEPWTLLRKQLKVNRLNNQSQHFENKSFIFLQNCRYGIMMAARQLRRQEPTRIRIYIPLQFTRTLFVEETISWCYAILIGLMEHRPKLTIVNHA